VNDRRAIDRENELRTRIAAAEARSIPKQTNNDEGSARDLQIKEKIQRKFGYWVNFR
jgi:hypothetical protein